MNDDKKPSHALPMRYYRDPLDVLLGDEAGTCKGCEREAIAFGTIYCTKGRPHGRRCKHYDERPGLGRAA